MVSQAEMKVVQMPDTSKILHASMQSLAALSRLFESQSGNGAADFFSADCTV